MRSQLRHRARPGPPRGRSSRLTIVVALLALVCAPLLTSCLDRSNLTGDRLWGRIIVAHKDTGQGKGPTITVPQSLSANVGATEYKQNGMIGTQATYTELTFGQFNQLSDLVVSAYASTPVAMDLSASRSGNAVTFRGSADFTRLTPGQNYVEFAVQFAGSIKATNGQQDGSDTATWKPEPGKSTTMTAEAKYADPSTATFGGWMILMAGIALAVVVIVIAVARVSRDQSPRPGAPGEPAPSPKELLAKARTKVKASAKK